jgi:hypothetical protein
MAVGMLAVPTDVDTDRLGALVWYTVRDITRPTRDEIARAVAATRLPGVVVPKPIASSDALRRTVRDLGTLPERTDDAGHIIRLLLREAPQTDRERLSYHLIRETGDKARVELHYEEVGELHLHKPTASLSVAAYGGITDAEERRVLDRASSTFDFNREHYNSQMVRDIVGKALQTADPVTVRPSGGVFFIGREHATTVQAAALFVCSFGGESRLYSVPVLDDSDSRTMIGDSLEAQVETEASRVIESLRELLASGRASEVATEASLRSLRGLAELTERYEGLLQTRIDGARAALEAAQAQARSLLEMV